MSYTVKELSKLSGVSVRTLHFYHEIGLLIPAAVGENNYRYYEEEQFLLLQQILFFRELGFQLKDIQNIISSNDFDKVEALKLHKKALTKNITRAQKLIKTIDKTILHLKGQIKMDNQEMYSGFDKEKQAKYDEYLINKYGETAKTLIAESKRRIKDWTQEDFNKVKQQHNALYAKFILAIENKLAPSSSEVQKLVKEHYKLVNIFYTPTKEVYGSLGQTYCEHPEFRKYFDEFHVKLAEYLAEAIKYYAEHELE